MFDPAKTDENVKEALETIGADLLKPEEKLAALVKDNNHLLNFLVATPVKHRKEAYNKLKPYLSFKPAPFYFLMMKHKHAIN